MTKERSDVWIPLCTVYLSMTTCCMWIMYLVAVGRGIQIRPFVALLLTLVCVQTDPKRANIAVSAQCAPVYFYNVSGQCSWQSDVCGHWIPPVCSFSVMCCLPVAYWMIVDPSCCASCQMCMTSRCAYSTLLDPLSCLQYAS